MATDPKIFRAKTVLGSLYVTSTAEDKIDHAKSYLLAARQYWTGRQPKDLATRRITVQTLQLLAEVRRRSGDLAAADSLLAEALGLWTGHLAEANPQLAFDITMQRGRVAAERSDDRRRERYALDLDRRE